MNLKLFNLLFIFSSTLSYSQKTVTVLDSTSKKPIPYVNVKMLHSKKGTYSNEEGVFDIKNNFNKNDTLLISCLGFNSILKKINNLKDTVFLSSTTEYLDEIVIKKEKPILKEIGFKKRKISFFTGNHLQLGLLITPNKNDIGSYIRNIIIPFKKKIIGKKAHKNRKKFYSLIKVQLFSVKENSPDIPLTSQPIIINYSYKSKKTINLDILNKYIELKKEGVFISLEIIGEIDESRNVINELNPRPGFICTDKKTLDFKKHDTFYKLKSENKWKKFDKEKFRLENDIYLSIRITLAKYEN